LSPGIGANFPDFHSALARSMRSRELETKFHHDAARHPTARAKHDGRVGAFARISTFSPGANTARRPNAALLIPPHGQAASVA